MDRKRAWSEIAEDLFEKGEWDECLRVRLEEELPAHRASGDERAEARTWGEVARVLFEKGELDESLRIRMEEELPIYVRLGDAIGRARTWGEIAGIYAHKGDWNESIRTRNEKELPVYELLDDFRRLAAGRANLAIALLKRKEEDDVFLAIDLLKWSCTEAHRRDLPEADVIRGILGSMRI